MNLKAMNEAQAEGATGATLREAPGEPPSPDAERSPRLPHPEEPHRSGFLAGMFQLLRGREPATAREDLAETLLRGTGDGAFSAEERAMLMNILALREERVEDVMIPRSRIEAVEQDLPLSELLDLFEASGHSRMPVYGEDLDDPLGMVHIRDVLAHVTRVARGGEGGADLDLSRVDLRRPLKELGLLRKVLFVPPSMLASDLMARMRATRTQMALVIDEYGGTDGLVTLEDIIEKVVGDIEDEHDAAEVLIVADAGGGFVADARADLDDVRALIGHDFDISEHEEEADTVGGLIFAALGRVPAEGEVVEVVPGFCFTVLEADPRRVRRVRIVRGGGRQAPLSP